MLAITLFLLGGLLLLYFGAEALVHGSSRLALRLGITPLVVGLTVVAFGTSAPELVVSIKASLVGQNGIAVGNVVGSNIFNIAAILGITALIRPLAVNRQLLRLDTPIMIGVTLLCSVLLLNRTLSRPEAVLLLLGIIAYVTLSVIIARRPKSIPTEKAQNRAEPLKLRFVVWDVLFIAVGLAFLVYGAHLFVEGSLQVARKLGVSEAVIGLTIVAAGTSLPELVTSVVASLRKKHDIAVGNIIGSNIFNLLAILGTAGLIHPLSTGGVTTADFTVMSGFAILLLPLMLPRHTLSRWAGALLLLLYAAYLTHLWPS